MSDERNDGDEELMSDFKDLFPDDEGEESAASPANDESLDELDAFLDDFEKNLDVPDAGQGANGNAERGDTLELNSEALDLDVGLDGEIFAEEPVLDEGEEPETAPAVTASDTKDKEELLDLDAMMDEAEASAVATPATAQEELVLETPPVEPRQQSETAPLAAPAADPAITPPPAPAPSRGQLIGGATVLGGSLLVSLAALWMGMSLGSQLETLNENVTELQQRVLAQSRRGTLATPAQLSDQLNRLGERVNELAVIVEGPVGHLRESNQQALQALGLRLDRLEKGQTTLPLAARQERQTTDNKAATTSKPLVSKVAAAAPTPSAKPATNTAAVKKGWVINLLSVTSARTAKEELARLRKMGIRADKQTVNKDGKSWYRLRVTGFDSYEGAKAYIETVEKQTGFNSAWVAKE